MLDRMNKLKNQVFELCSQTTITTTTTTTSNNNNNSLPQVVDPDGYMNESLNEWMEERQIKAAKSANISLIDIHTCMRQVRNQFSSFSSSSSEPASLNSSRDSPFSRIILSMIRRHVKSPQTGAADSESNQIGWTTNLSLIWFLRQINHIFWARLHMLERSATCCSQLGEF